MTIQLIDLEEWCGECSDATADKVLIDANGSVLGFYCDPCGEQELERIKEKMKPRAVCPFQRNSNRQCLLDDEHTGDHNLPCVEASAHDAREHGAHAKGGLAADGKAYWCNGHRFDRT